MNEIIIKWITTLCYCHCKFFPRKATGGSLEGVLFVYYKNDGVVRLDRLCDIGTMELSAPRLEALCNIKGNVELESPKHRCTVVRNEYAFYDVVTDDPDFYIISKLIQVYFTRGPTCNKRILAHHWL
jgi:hypothetical protein